MSYTNGIDYLCDTTQGYCYGLTLEIQNNFRAFQRTINAFAGPGGFAQIPVDGQIGPLTYAGAINAGKSAGIATTDFSDYVELTAVSDSFNAALSTFEGTAQTITNQTYDAVDDLLSFVGSLTSGGGATTMAPSTTPTTPNGTLLPSALAPTAASSNISRGAIVVVALAIGGAFLYYRKTKKASV